MKFLVAEESSAVRESLCYVLLTFGIQGLPVANRQEALAAIQGDPELEGAVVDVDSRTVEGIELIKQLKGEEDCRLNNIIVHTVQSSKEFVVRMMELGVVGYLTKPYQAEEAAARLKKIFEKTRKQDNKRKHIRIKPDPEELLRLHFRLPDYEHLIAGKVLNISLGGVAVELFNPPPAEVLNPGKTVIHIHFTLQGRELSPSGRVILFRGQVLALRFESLNITEKTSLARYIFKRIST